MNSAGNTEGPAPLGCRDPDARERETLDAFLEAARSLGFSEAELERLRALYDKLYRKEPS